MAKKSGKSRGSQSKAKTEEPIIDAEIVEDADVATPDELERALSEDVEAAPEGDDVTPETDTTEQPESEEVAEAAAEGSPSEDLEPVTSEETSDSDETPVSEPVEEPEPAPEPEPEPAPAPAPAPAAAPAERPSVVVPMMIGGVIAGVIGYGVAYMQFNDQTPMATAADLEVVSDQIAELPPPTDISGLTEEVGTLGTGITDLSDRIDASLAALEERIVVLERQPNADGTLTDTALAAFEADMAALREQLSATEASAIDVREDAVEAARRATGRAALARVQGALETGEPFAALLPELESALQGPTPDAIAAVSDGVPTLNALQTAFPDAARAALATARSEGVDGEAGGGLGAFLRTQLNARSTQPQDGDGVDAVLSRVEGAMSEGRLNDALAEAAALPDVAKAALSDWLAQAEARAAALDAAETLATSLSD